MGTTSGIFTGGSHFAADFQNVIDRATAIASLPIKQLTADQADLSGQSNALTGIDARFRALQTAVQGIANSLTGSAFEANFGNPVSDPGTVNVSLSSGASEGSYTIDVVDAGAYATSMTSSGWVSAGVTRTYQLSLGGVKYSLSPTDNSAGSVVAAINASQGDKVHATVVNVGSGASPDYRISLQSVKLGDLQPGLWVGPAAPASLQAQQASGSDTRSTSQTTQTWDANPALTYKLSISGATYDISPADNTAQGIADAINSQFGDKASAAVVDLGGGDLRISLTAVNAGDTQPDLLADDGVSGPTSIQTQQAAGSDTKATSQTAATWVSAGPTLTYQLSLGGVQYDVAVADNSADSLVSAINTQHGDKVTAAVVDLGGDLRISLTAVDPGDLRPDLLASAVEVQNQQTTGALAHYIVNNSGKDVSSDTRSVAIATGITVALVARDNGTPVNFTVTRPTSALSDALSAFADAYSATVDELDQQHGQSGGALAGQSILSGLSSTLTAMATYTSDTGGIAGLHALGLDLDKTGHLTFNPFGLAASDLTSSFGVTSFLGSVSSGFLKLAFDSLNRLEDPLNGLLTTAQAEVQNQIDSLADTIAEQQARVDAMTQRMQEQMAAADALISAMEQKYSYLSGMFEAMRTADGQYK